MKHEKLRLPTLLLAIWMLIVAIPMVCFAEQDAPLDIPEDQLSQAEEQDESNSTVEKDVSLTQTAYKNNTLADMFVKVSYEPIVNNSDSISVSFDTDKIIKYNIDTNGVQIVSSSTKEGIVKLNALDEFGVVSIGLVFEDGSQNQYKLYTYRTNSQTFMSALIVLDPTSNKMSYYGENFSEGLAPELTLNLSSSKEYLILYCAARASSEQDQPALNLYIITAD